MPELVEIRSLVRQRDYPGVADALLLLHDRDHRLLAEAGPVVAGEPGFHELVVGQLARERDDVLARALLAQSHVVRAFETRGGLPASLVTPEQYERYAADLRAAEVHLIEVCAVEPSWFYPWHLRVVTSRTLELGLSETRRRYDRIAEDDAHHHPAQAELLQQLCPKWGGTWEDALGFARATSAAAPAGSAEHGLVADVHLERWVALPRREQAAYLKDPAVLDELSAAAAASVEHPDFVRQLSWVRLHTTFGALFALAGRRDVAADHFATLGDVVDGRVWAYLAQDVGVVQKARKAGLARAGAA